MRGTSVPKRRRLLVSKPTWIVVIAVLAVVQMFAAAPAYASSPKPPPRPETSQPTPGSTDVGPTQHGKKPKPSIYDVGDAHLTLKRGSHPAGAAQASGLNCAPGLPCLNLSNHGGMVMHSATAFLVFWLPSGSTAPSSQYERLLSRYFYDAGATPYFGLLGQYCDSSGCPANSLSLGGTWVDTGNSYPHAGTQNDPVQDGDIHDEINRAISANNGNNNAWAPSNSRIYLVYTAPNINSCLDSGTCTFSTPHFGGFCAYHSHYGTGFLGLGQEVIYANMPYDGALGGCDISGVPASGPNAGSNVAASPNNDLAADSEISVTSHELFESVTDPNGDAWYGDSSLSDEIGDLCNFFLGPTINADGSNVALHFDEFAVQQEWSNRNSGCFLPQSPATALQGEPATATLDGRTAATNGCTQKPFPANDDGSTFSGTLPFTLNFFGTQYSQLYVNNNGNVTFGSSLSTFTPFGLTSTNTPIVAPYFADVDTRGARSGIVTYGGQPAAGNIPAYFCVNWINVGYYGFKTNKLNSFQLILTDQSAVTRHAGDFTITYNYGSIQWETGEASGGVDGLGGSSARVGYSNGVSQSLELAGSGVNGAFINGGPDALVSNSLNSAQSGRYMFPVTNGVTPTGGTITGLVTDNASPAQPVASALVQLCSVGTTATTCTLTTTTSAGRYTGVGLAPGSYEVTVSPPSGSQLFQQSQGPVAVSQGGTLELDFALQGPQPLPNGTTIGGNPNSSGTPVLFWQTSSPLSTHGCAGGIATFSLVAANSSTGVPGTITGSLAETPSGSGTYTGTIPPLYPLHGAGQVTITITCPDPNQNSSTGFSIYIDPSGSVVDTSGNPVAGATVTLLQADSAAGPFAAVPAGSAVMSPANRNNPDATTSAGTFGWDVLAGFYEVQASAAGCSSPADPTQPVVVSAVFQVPPPMTSLRLVLNCNVAAPQTITFNPLANATYGDAPLTVVASASSGLPVSFSSDTPTVCSVAGSTITILAAGTCTVRAAQAGSASWLPAPDVTQSFTVVPKPATVNVTPAAVEYAEPLPNLNVIGSVSGLVGSDTLAGSLGGCTATGLQLSASGTVISPAGSYALTGCGGLSNPNYAVGYSGSLTVTKEAATVAYTGDMFFSTGSATATSGPATLSAAVTQEADSYPGDLSNARIEFDIFASNNFSGTPDHTFYAQANAQGVASTVQNLSADNYIVSVRVDPGNGFFTSPFADAVVVTVYTPLAGVWVTGGGWITDPSFENRPVAISSSNSHGNFGFNVRYKKGSTTIPQGQLVYVFRGSDGYDYVVKSNSWEGGGAAFTNSTASFSGKASVTIIDPSTGAIIGGGGNYTFRVDVSDATPNTFAISVYSPGGALYHQAGVPASEIPLGGGQIVVHS
jgi:hypothetical protein